MDLVAHIFISRDDQVHNQLFSLERRSSGAHACPMFFHGLLRSEAHDRYAARIALVEAHVTHCYALIVGNE